MCEKEINYKDYTIEIYRDDIIEANDHIMEGLSERIICFHPKYRIGNYHKYNNMIDLKLDISIMYDNKIEDLIEYWESGKGYSYLANRHENPISISDDKIIDIIEKCFDKHVISLPLYLYDHSKLMINTTGFSCPWDSGEVGIIYIKISDVKEEYQWKNITKKRRDKIKERLVNCIKTYNYYLMGEIYGYFIKDKDNKEIDSCWGFYGFDHDESGLLNQAKNVINNL
jgi:hypothetical protein